MFHSNPNHSMKISISKYLLWAALAGHEAAIQELDLIIKKGDCQMIWKEYSLVVERLV